MHIFKSSADSALVFQTSAVMLLSPGVLFLFSEFRHTLSSSSVKSSVLIGGPLLIFGEISLSAICGGFWRNALPTCVPLQFCCLPLKLLSWYLSGQ